MSDGQPETNDPNPDGKGKKDGGSGIELLIAAGIALAVEAIKALVTVLQGRSIVGEISNNTNSTLTKIADHHDSGGFKQAPPPRIAPQSAVGFTSETTGFLRGTIGTVTYQGDGFTATFEWHNAEIGSNSANTAIVGVAASKLLEAHAAGSGNTGAHMQYWLFRHPDYSVKATFSDRVVNGVLHIRSLRPGGGRLSVRDLVSHR